jgi:hypothetical protein
VRCFRLLAAPRLPPLVYQLTLIPLERNRRTPITVLAYYTLLASVLRSVQNLLSLRVLKDSVRELKEGDFGATCGTILKGTTFQLKRLECSYGMDSDLASFLLWQSSIREFAWESIRGEEYTFPSQALPNLSVLIMKMNFNPSIADLLCRNRFLTHMDLRFVPQTPQSVSLLSETDLRSVPTRVAIKLARA